VFLHAFGIIVSNMAMISSTSAMLRMRNSSYLLDLENAMHSFDAMCWWRVSVESFAVFYKIENVCFCIVFKTN